MTSYQKHLLLNFRRFKGIFQGEDFIFHFILKDDRHNCLVNKWPKKEKKRSFFLTVVVLGSKQHCIYLLFFPNFLLQRFKLFRLSFILQVLWQRRFFLLQTLSTLHDHPQLLPQIVSFRNGYALHVKIQSIS